jgi:hypothetical protein
MHSHRKRLECLRRRSDLPHSLLKNGNRQQRTGWLHKDNHCHILTCRLRLRQRHCRKQRMNASTCRKLVLSKSSHCCCRDTFPPHSGWPNKCSYCRRLFCTGCRPPRHLYNHRTYGRFANHRSDHWKSIRWLDHGSFQQHTWWPNKCYWRQSRWRDKPYRLLHHSCK